MLSMVVNKMSKPKQVSNRFSRALTVPTKDRPVLDMVMSTAEATADIMMKDEWFAAVPVFSTAFKAMKALDSTRDRLFAAKLQEFIAQAETMTTEARANLAHKLTTDDEGKKAAETLLLVLDKLTDMDKPALLGSLLKHFGNGRMNTEDLRRLSAAVDLAFADDLAAFLDESPDGINLGSNGAHREALVAAGLTRMITGQSIDSLGSITFIVTTLGKLLHALVNE